MLSRTKIAVSVAIVLSTILPTSAATKYHRSPMAAALLIERFTARSSGLVVVRLVARSAVALARVLALVHHQADRDDAWAMYTPQ